MHLNENMTSGDKSRAYSISREFMYGKLTSCHDLTIPNQQRISNIINADKISNLNVEHLPILNRSFHADRRFIIGFGNHTADSHFA